MTVTSGAKFSSIYGMYGGYGCGTYPLAMVKGTNVYEHIRRDNKTFDLSIEKVMNERPFEDGRYSTYHMGLQFDIAKDGELYMISQGAGGGYGDPLERVPESVVRDAELGRISQKVAEEIFGVRYDPATFRLDVEGTDPAARDAARAGTAAARQAVRRVLQGLRHTGATEGPAYYGSWGTDRGYHGDGVQHRRSAAGHRAPRRAADRHGPRPPRVKINIRGADRELEAKYGETVNRLA